MEIKTKINTFTSDLFSLVQPVSFFCVLDKWEGCMRIKGKEGREKAEGESNREGQQSHSRCCSMREWPVTVSSQP